MKMCRRPAGLLEEVGKVGEVVVELTSLCTDSTLHKLYCLSAAFNLEVSRASGSLDVAGSRIH